MYNWFINRNSIMKSFTKLEAHMILMAKIIYLHPLVRRVVND